MNRTEAERHSERIEAILTALGYTSPSVIPYGILEAVSYNGDDGFKVLYRGEWVYLDLTKVEPQVAASAIWRWNSSNYRALRANFNALLDVAENASEIIWLEPMLDRIELIRDPVGVLSIESIGESSEYRLLWRAADTSNLIDLSVFSPLVAVRELFGEEGVNFYKAHCVKINEQIASYRERLGLYPEDIADKLGLSYMGYYHIEAYPDAFTSELDLREAKQLCRELQIDINVVLDLPPLVSSTGSLHCDKAILLKARRIEMGISTEQLSDLTNMIESAVSDAEHDSDALESWTVESVLALATALNLPASVLLE